jgi:hypothetical protein
MLTSRPSGFIPPCIPTRAYKVPSGPGWVYEIKHDGYRLQVRRDGSASDSCQQATRRPSASVLVFHAYPVGPSPHDDAMPGGVIKVQVEFNWQIGGILQP